MQVRSFQESDRVPEASAWIWSYLNSRYEKYVNTVSRDLKLHSDGEERQSSQKAMRLGHVTLVTKHMAYLKVRVCVLLRTPQTPHVRSMGRFPPNLILNKNEQSDPL